MLWIESVWINGLPKKLSQSLGNMWSRSECVWGCTCRHCRVGVQTFSFTIKALWPSQSPPCVRAGRGRGRGCNVFIKHPSPSPVCDWLLWKHRHTARLSEDEHSPQIWAANEAERKKSDSSSPLSLSLLSGACYLESAHISVQTARSSLKLRNSFCLFTRCSIVIFKCVCLSET